MRTNQSKKSNSPNGTNPLPPKTKIDLPKGGGAIADIGEKFKTNPVTGSATVSVPIMISPGRDGFQPALTLSYDSGSGNGPFGIGWTIGLSSIRRKTSKGIPRYRKSDVFQIEGEEDLVPFYEDDNADGNFNLLSYRSVDGGFDIVRFRPRIENGFARIEQWSNRGTGDIHWQVTSAQNITTVYGESQSARIVNPEAPEQIFAWFPEYTFDAKGQILRYSYKQEDMANVPVALHELHRHKSSHLCTQTYLKSVQYGNTLPYSGQTDFDTQNEWLFQLVFDYGEHNESLPTLEEEMEWQVRPDSFSVYRSGFEQRTYRLCQRVLMFHNFNELGTEACLVGATEFIYEKNEVISRLQSVTHSSFEKQVGPGYFKASMPSMEFKYTEAIIDEKVKVVKNDLGEGLDQEDIEWTDLFSEGLVGMLRKEEAGWYYQRNQGVGVFGQPEIVASHSSLANNLLEKGQLVDIGGNGKLDLLVNHAQLTGYCEMQGDESWGEFKSFPEMPQIDWQDPQLRMLDLTGDGLPDLAISEENCIRVYFSKGKEGYSASETAIQSLEDQRGFSLVFADSEETIYSADMTGDGLADILRIRNGQICYWPNMGYGKFGAKVLMSYSPRFDQIDSFDQKRIRLSDIDGSGTTDLVYLSLNGPQIYLNQSGNSWSEVRELNHFPSIHELSRIRVMDLLGNGTACLVWTSQLSSESQSGIRFIDLMGKKPYLLSEVNNNMGGLQRYEYGSSTEFYLNDKRKSQPWASRLPFPVQVVKRSESYDEITGTRFVNIFAYHHGYYDGHEREFRGFGMVEQWDSENFEGLVGENLFPVGTNEQELASNIPPIHTKTWYHTGSYLEGEGLENQYQKEFFKGDQLAWNLAKCKTTEGLKVGEIREAVRALKGKILRQEVYAQDGGSTESVPYTVSESNHQVQMLQPGTNESNAAFLVYLQESLVYDYERNPSDPRIKQVITLKTDPKYGMVQQKAFIHYPRRYFTEAEQGELHISLEETDFFHVDNSPENYRIGVIQESRKYELHEVPVAFPLDASLSSTDLDSWLSSATDLNYEDAPVANQISRRLIKRNRLLYYNLAANTALPAGQIAAHGLPVKSSEMVFTQGLLTDAFGTKVDSNMLQNEGHYELFEGSWWIPSGQTLFDLNNFYSVVSEVDAAGNTTTIGYDPYFLFANQINNALNQSNTAKYDYRVLKPYEVTDSNGNRKAVGFDTLGVVVLSAIMGKEGLSEGDSLAEPTTEITYDLFQWKDHRSPNFVKSRSREIHQDSNSPWHESYLYTGGMGQEVLSKIQAEPGLAFGRNPDGSLKLDTSGEPILEMSSTRWVGSGRTILNNKGNPVKQYEPYFSNTHQYETEAEIREYGVSPTIQYDPLGRQIRIDHPDGTFQKIIYSSWEKVVHDENDTVLESDWYSDRNSPNPNANEPADPVERAAWLTAQHANTASKSHLDSLGRAFLVVQDNGNLEYFLTRTEFDIEGNTLKITDPKGRVVSRSQYNMAGVGVYDNNSDKGERFSLHNVFGKPLRSWNTRGFEFRSVYDPLNRLSETRVTPPGGTEALVTYTVYGAQVSSASAQNLNGQVYARFDQSGLLLNDSFDFKGNLLQQSKWVAMAYQQTVDWADLPSNSVPDKLLTASNRLSTEVFVTSTEYDALNRPIKITTPDNSIALPGYNEANLLESLSIQLRGGSTWEAFVQNIDYDAKGQRVSVQYGNGAQTTYQYDPRSLRLKRLMTTRNTGQDVLQDLQYTYDPIGNITEIKDEAQQVHYFNNTVVQPGSKYVYDPLYRLVTAKGREHAGIGSQNQLDSVDLPIMALPHLNNATALRSYEEAYEYDGLGNLLGMVHTATNGSWNRAYKYDNPNNNYLTRTTQSGSSSQFDSYSYDVHGNMTSMPHLNLMVWDYADQLKEVDLGGGGKAHFIYDAEGKRSRKVVVYQNGSVKERIYVSGYEVFREYVSEAALQNGNVKLERETLSVMDEAQRIATVETKTIENGVGLSLPIPLQRFQFENHLGSASLELDENAAIVSYEEYHPFGTSAYRAGKSASETTLKRYRYTGKERDEATGLYYYGARYYACWLGRWAAADPAGFVDGLNLYAYVKGNPIILIDPDGKESDLLKRGKEVLQNRAKWQRWKRQAKNSMYPGMPASERKRLEDGVKRADVEISHATQEFEGIKAKSEARVKELDKKIQDKKQATQKLKDQVKDLEKRGEEVKAEVEKLKEKVDKAYEFDIPIVGKITVGVRSAANVKVDVGLVKTNDAGVSGYSFKALTGRVGEFGYDDEKGFNYYYMGQDGKFKGTILSGSVETGAIDVKAGILYEYDKEKGWDADGYGGFGAPFVEYKLERHLDKDVLVIGLQEDAGKSMGAWDVLGGSIGIDGKLEIEISRKRNQ